MEGVEEVIKIGKILSEILGIRPVFKDEDAIPDGDADLPELFDDALDFSFERVLYGLYTLPRDRLRLEQRKLPDESHVIGLEQVGGLFGERTEVLFEIRVLHRLLPIFDCRHQVDIGLVIRDEGNTVIGESFTFILGPEICRPSFGIGDLVSQQGIAVCGGLLGFGFLESFHSGLYVRLTALLNGTKAGTSCCFRDWEQERKCEEERGERKNHSHMHGGKSISINGSRSLRSGLPEVERTSQFRIFFPCPHLRFTERSDGLIGDLRALMGLLGFFRKIRETR